MHVGSLALRAFVATILTGISSALIMSLGAALILGVAAGHGFAGEIFFGLWVVGGFVATVVSVILGIFIEWPKAFWLSKQSRGGMALHLSSSAIAALAFLAVWLKLTPEPTFRSSGEGWIFLSCAFLIGGICLGSFWWSLVTLPLRRSRKNALSG